MNSKYLSVLSLLIASASFAQNSSAPVQKTILEKSYQQAQAELARVQPLLTAEYAKDDYRPCVARELEIQKQYNEWFIQHYSEFQSEYGKVQSVINNANKKLSSIKSSTVLANPMQGQKSEVTVTLDSMIKYFDRYNKRIKVCSKDERAQLDQDMQYPERTGLNVAHDQVLVAIKMLTAELNASMKEQSVAYELAFSEAECGYKLEFNLVFNFEGNETRQRIVLLDPVAKPTQNQFALVEKSVWEMLMNRQTKVSGMPMDGLVRYRELIEKNQQSCKNLPKIPYVKSDLPYVNYADLAATVKKSENNYDSYGTRQKVFAYTDDACRNLLTEVTVESTKLKYFGGSQVWSVRIGDMCVNIQDRSNFSSIEETLVKLTQQPISVDPVLKVYSDDYCRNEVFGFSTGMDLRVFSDVFSGFSICSIQVKGGSCINVSDRRLTSNMLEDLLHFAENEQRRDHSGTSGIELFNNDVCGASSKITTVQPKDDCSLLNVVYGNFNIWSVKIDGICQNINDTSFINGCEFYTR